MANNTKNVLVFEGFDDWLDLIKEAQGDVPAAIKEAATAGAEAYKDILIEKCNAAGIDSRLTNQIQTKIEMDAGGERVSASVGWHLPTYDPTNPADGYKIVFANYGTPRRQVFTDETMRVQIDGQWKTLNSSHKGRGKEIERGFIAAAKKAAKSKVKAAQKKALNKIIEDLTL